MTRIIVSLFGGIAVLLLTVLGIGLALPSDWTAEQTMELDHPSEDLFPYLEDLARWDAWTVWSEFESVLSNPSAGVGATRTWDDPEYGGGQIELTEVTPEERIRYRVELEGSAWVEGEITLARRPNGTEVTWVESGDFGWNPLMGFMARRLPESQKMQMSEGLKRLGDSVAGQSEVDGSRD